MVNTTTLEGFDIIVDYGNFYWDIFPITKFSKSANLDEALKVIAEKTGKSTSNHEVSEHYKTITVLLGR
jgi:hypothetical protein